MSISTKRFNILLNFPSFDDKDSRNERKRNIVRNIINLCSTKFFLQLFFFLKTLGNFVRFSSFEQVFLGLENLCEYFNNILENAFNPGKFIIKITLILH